MIDRRQLFEVFIVVTVIFFDIFFFPQSQLQHHIWLKCGWSSNSTLLNATLQQRSPIPGAQTSSSTGHWPVRNQAI